MESLNQQMLKAAMQGDLDAVRTLVSQGADINYRDKWSNTAIFSAAWNGNVKALETFYDLGANLDLGDANLLCNAAFNAQVESVKWLMQKGEDSNYTLKETGENALHYVISQTNNMDARTEIVKLLVNSGTDVNKRTIPGRVTLCFMRDAFLKGEVPLHRAAAYGDEAMINALLEGGADPSTKDKNGDTPISWGSWHLRPSSVLRLLVYGDVTI
ncbi:MAG TPA: ankyrin repeat domain-containing protein [Chryseolinea sp.]|nr:ankyrin repeat domain-containing protein [Chryseolinea sp.]